MIYFVGIYAHLNPIVHSYLISYVFVCVSHKLVICDGFFPHHFRVQMDSDFFFICP